MNEPARSEASATEVGADPGRAPLPVDVGRAAVDRASFDEQGFLVLRDWIPSDLRRRLREGWEWSAAFPRTRGDRFVENVADVFSELVRHEVLLDAARPLLGEDLAIYFSRLMVKDETWSGAVPPHQESPYFHGGLRKLMVFVPLAPMNRVNGGLFVVPGSHRFGALGRVNDHEIDLAAFPGMHQHHVDMDLGDVLVFDYLLWHGSEEAIEPRSRPLFHVVYQPSSDGSHYGGRPELACGRWLTDRFLPFHHGVIERGPATAMAMAPASDAPVESLRKRLEPASMTRERGHCTVVHLDDALTSDADGRSRLILWEDDTPLPSPHALHAEIREQGMGRWSHWQDVVFFSATDNSDPRHNGRVYSITLGA
ncbi:MAG: phytanoyl-CoA dioxygenase family protein [Planctomycetes bacterium]|nr:phytanoyl-CoA dioxygenase family protein [Planctomycetota bacterium]